MNQQSVGLWVPFFVVDSKVLLDDCGDASRPNSSTGVVTGPSLARAVNAGAHKGRKHTVDEACALSPALLWL